MHSSGKKGNTKSYKTAILIHRVESWTVTEGQKRNLTATEMRFTWGIEDKTKMDRFRKTLYNQTLQIKTNWG